VVSVNAVQQGQKGSFVYVVNSDQRVEPRLVDASSVVNGQQWIRKGLAPGETVVVQGQSRIAAGVKVSVVKTDVVTAQPPANAEVSR
ncbi:efflux RND transporter periplasmic adaptor subunit, partial [Pseudomonas sp. CCC3.2]|nr:efflux RND transporter periplasmic adaptor subunit [Pseudomonas sp. CCC3.2]